MTTSLVQIITKNPGFVLGVYLLCILPLGIPYLPAVFDGLWRQVLDLYFLSILYVVLFIIRYAVVITYAAFQIVVKDYQEAGTTIVLVLVATNGVTKLARLIWNLRVHREIIHGPVVRINKLLEALLPHPGPHYGSHHHYIHISFKHFLTLIGGERAISQEKRRSIPSTSGNIGKDNGEQSPMLSLVGKECDEIARHLHFSTRVFTFGPAQSTEKSRIRHMSRIIQLLIPSKTRNLQDVANRAMKLALYMRFAVRPPRYELWTILVPTHKLVTIKGHISLGKALRRLISYGSDTGPESVDREKLERETEKPIPESRQKLQVLNDPVEYILQEVSAGLGSNNPRFDMTIVGTSLYWTAAHRNAHDGSPLLDNFPDEWRKGVFQTYPQLVFEASILLVLAGEQVKGALDNTKEIQTAPEDPGKLKREYDADDVEAQTVQANTSSQTASSSSTRYLGSTLRSIIPQIKEITSDDPQHSTCLSDMCDGNGAGRPAKRTENLATSWARDFKDADCRKRLANLCAMAVASFLRRPGNPEERAESSVLHDEEFMGAASGEPAGKIERISQEAFETIFDFFAEGRVQMVIDGKEEDPSERNGWMLGEALFDLIETTEVASLVTDVLIGPELGRNIRRRFGPEACVRHAALVFGLAALVTRLGIGTEGVDRVLDHWWEKWNYEGPRRATMLQVVNERVLTKYRAGGLGRRSGMEWMASADSRAHAEDRCPNHVEAFEGFAEMAAYLAEGVFVGICAWTGHGESPRVARVGEDWETAAMAMAMATMTREGRRKKVVVFPRELTSPELMRRRFMEWKRVQGKATAGNTFAAMYSDEPIVATNGGRK